MSREQKLAEDKDQILGTAREYDGSILVGGKAEDVESHLVSSTDYVDGALRTGRCVLNVRVCHFADGNLWDLYDDLLANGRYRVPLICDNDFPYPHRRSIPAVTKVCCTLIHKHHPRTVEAIILQPDMGPAWHFDDLSARIKEEAKMRLYCASQEVSVRMALIRSKALWFRSGPMARWA